MLQPGKSKIEAHLHGIVSNLPEAPGCYQYMDETGEIIYVGKAKNLKRRVSSYFNKDQQSNKTRVLVSKIRDIKYIVVQTEGDALLLENNLIKKHKPRYNVLLKDDKTYPSICVTHEAFPRIFKTRNRTLKHCTYFGPYSHVPGMQALLDICHKLYKPRICRLALTPETIREGRWKVCLEYHIKKCDAPCVGLQSNEEYAENIKACMQILRGNTGEVMRAMVNRMRALADEMRFEEAQEIKKKYDLIEGYKAKSEVVSSLINDVDVFSIDSEGDTAYINYLHITNGCINQAFTFEYKKKLDETAEELLSMGIVEMRERYRSKAREIILPISMEIAIEGVSITVPQRGEKKKLLDLSQLNVRQYKLDRLKQADKLNPEQKAVRLMKEIQQILGIEHLPLRIELFDNSNISGTDAVAACVVFDKLQPAKSEYRKYNIKTVAGPDDYASMREVVARRYSRIKEEGGTLPSLIITDGGRGQMEVVRQVVEYELGLNIPIAGLAKDGRHRTHELLFGFPTLTIGLKTDSPLFRLLTRMQDEVHRFAISFHRDKRSKRQTASALDGIKGVGVKTKSLLLKEFGSVKRLREASEEQICKIIGEKRGLSIYAALHEADNKKE